MNKFSLTFLNRQTQIRTNSFLNLLTSFGPAPVQYCPCTERFAIKDGCTNWTYDFCIQDCDIPSGLSICALTEDVLEAPYLEPFTIEFEDSPTAEVNGAGTELNPYRVDVKISADPDNDLVILPDGLFVEEEGTPGAPGEDGSDGVDGSDGTDGVNGADGAPGADGADGAAGAGPAVGSVFFLTGNTAPVGTEPLTGQLLNRIAEPELWAFALTSGNLIDDATWLGDTAQEGHFSSGDGINTFRIPRVSGYFLRANNESDTDGPDQERDMGSIQEDAIRNIEGEARLGGEQVSATGAFQTGPGNLDGSVKDSTPDASLLFDASNVVPTADENRPYNVAYMAVIQSRSVV